jgi:predicted GH43/DUF377 family glycosyl hydrolase
VTVPLDEADELVAHSEIRLTADPTRVLAQLFVPGHELLADHQSRATGVLARILALPEDTVATVLARIHDHFAGRHRDLPAVFLRNYLRIAHRVPDTDGLSDARRSVIGAWFTHEFAIEGAALFNPSAVAHPDQDGLQPGQLRFVLSLRAVGEGHLSCVEFRTGVLGPGNALQLDDPGRQVETGHAVCGRYERRLFEAKLRDAGADAESTRFFVGRLADHFDSVALDLALTALRGQRVTRHGGARTDELARRIASCSYDLDFAPESSIAERVIWPHSPSESRGIEDARFVRFIDDDGTARYLATYTAFDGEKIEPQVMATDDFRHFRISQLAGPAARDKGMALFPRKIGGRFFSLTRWDRESNWIADSDDGLLWGEPVLLTTPVEPWELIQIGNCGSPVETAAGWVVITHGVGPMREYSIGALLLDLENPRRVIGKLRDPMVVATESDRDGYVPNVVYSCGSLLHGDCLLLPYGASDASVRFAFVDMPLLLERLTTGAPATIRANRSA